MVRVVGDKGTYVRARFDRTDVDFVRGEAAHDEVHAADGDVYINGVMTVLSSGASRPIMSA